MTSERAFEEGGFDGRPSTSGGLPDGDIRMLAVRRTGEALARLLDDLNRWVEAHAEVTGTDHLGHVSTRLDLARRHDDLMAAQRAAADPEQVRRARRWARNALAEARHFQERFPRRASAYDFAHALSAAVRLADEYRLSGAPVPAAADLVAAVAAPVIIKPEPNPNPGGVSLIARPPATNEPPALDEPSSNSDAGDDPPRPEPTPLSAADRHIAAERIKALITGTVDQIDRVLVLADVLHRPHTDGHPRQQSGQTTGHDLDVTLACAIEIKRLRAADYTRRHQDAMRLLTATSPTREGEQT